MASGVHFDQPTFFGTGTLLQKGNVTGIPVSPPISMFARFNATGDMGAFGAVLGGIYRMPPGFGGAEFYSLEIRGNGSIVADCCGPFSFNTPSVHDGPWVVGTTHTAAAVFSSTTSRLVYFDGSAGVANTQTNQANGLEDVLVGAASTVDVGDWTGGYDGCLRDYVIWDVALTPEEIAFANGLAFFTADNIPQPTHVKLWVPLVSATTKVQAFAWNGSAIAAVADLTAIAYEPPGFFDGDCESEPIASDCPTCEEDFTSCGDEEEPACNAEWPYSELQPRSVGVFFVPATLGGGKSIADGHEQADGTSNGFWRFRYERIPIHSNAQIRRWHELEALCDGRGGVLCIHAYDGKRAPWLTVGGAIDIKAEGVFVAGARSGSIKVTTGGVPAPGMLFSYEDRLYELTSVGTPSGSPPVYPVTILPNVRRVIPSASPLVFDRPTCRVRLADDDGMRLPLYLHKHSSPSVDFEEDI